MPPILTSIEDDSVPDQPDLFEVISISDSDSEGLSITADVSASPHRPPAPSEPVVLAHRSTNIVVELPQSTLVQPRSLFARCDTPSNPDHGTEPIETISEAPSQRTWTESRAVTSILEQNPSLQAELDEGADIEILLDDFAIYLDSTTYPSELRPLQHLATRFQSDCFLFDGYLCLGHCRFFLSRVPFFELPIANYGKEHDSVQGQVLIRSQLNMDRDREIYYKLGNPQSNMSDSTTLSSGLPT